MEKPSSRGAGRSLRGDHARRIIPRAAEGGTFSDPDADRMSLGDDRRQRIMRRPGPGPDAASSSCPKARPRHVPAVTDGSSSGSKTTPSSAFASDSASGSKGTPASASGSKGTPATALKAHPHRAGVAHQHTAVLRHGQAAIDGFSSGYKGTTSGPKARPHLPGSANQRPTIPRHVAATTATTSPELDVSQHRVVEARGIRRGVFGVTQKEFHGNSRISSEKLKEASISPTPGHSGNGFILQRELPVGGYQRPKILLPHEADHRVITSSSGPSDIAAKSKSTINNYFQLEAIGDQVTKSFKLPREVYEPLFVYQKEALHWFWSLHCKKK